MAKKKKMIKSIDRNPTDERHEKNLAIVERYCLVSDEDGHNYVIPLARKIEFDVWQETDAESEDFKCELFSEFRIEGGLLTFTDPKVG